MRIRSRRRSNLTQGLVILLLASACGRGGGPSPTPPAIPPPDTSKAVGAPTSTPPPIIPAATAAIDPSTVSDLGPFPLDLVTIDPGNVGRLAPFRELTAAGLAGATSGGTLAFLASYEHGLVGHFDDGRTIVWNMASGEVRYQDRHPNDGSRFLENPPLAISPAFQGYLATAALTEESGTAADRSIVIRPPYASDDTFLLPAAGTQPDDTARVMSLAFSPDGHRLAVGIGGWQGGTLQVWDIWDRDDRRLIREIAFGDEVTALQFTPDGSGLVCAIEDALVTLDPNEGTELGRRSFDFLIRGFSFMPSAESGAVWGSQIGVLESASIGAPLTIQATKEFGRVAFSPDEQLAIATDGGQLRFWDLSTVLELASVSSRHPFLDAAMLDNGRVLATLDTVGVVTLWGVRAGYQLPQQRAMVSRGNAARLERAASLYIPGSSETRFTSEMDLLVVGSSEGVYLVDLPGLGLRRLLPQDDRGYTVFDASVDGSKLAWVADQGVVKIWNPGQDRLDREITGLGEGCCWQVLLTPDARYLVTLADLTARVRRASGGPEIYARDGVQQVHASPDGTRLAFEQGLDVNILDLKTMKDVKQLTGFTTAAPVTTTKFSPDWSVMYWAGRASMQLVDATSGKLGPAVPFSWGEFSPRGDRIAVVEAGWIYQTVGQVHMLDVYTGETLAVFDHHEDAIVQALAFSPDGRLVATALGGTIKIWDGLSGEEVATLPKAGGSVYELSFSPDRRLLLSLSEGDLVELWAIPAQALPTADLIRVATARSVAQVGSLVLGEGATDAVFSPDMGSIAVATASGAIWSWNLADGQAIERETAHTDWIYRLAYNRPGTGLASVSKDGSFRERRAPHWYGSDFDAHGSELSALAYLPDGKTVVTGGQDGTLQFRQLPYPVSTQTVEGHAAWVWSLAVSPAGDLLASASADRSIKLWKIEVPVSGVPQVSLIRTLTGHTATIWGVAFSPDGGTLASASWDGTVRLWDVSSGEQLAVLEGHTDWVYDVTYSPDGSLLASSSADGTIRLWDAETGEALATLVGPGGRIWSVDFSPDGRSLVSASDGGEVSLWGLVR